MTNTVKRLRFDRVEITEEAGGECRAEVTISLGDSIIKGEAVHSSEGAGKMKAAAIATLRAMVEAADGRFTATLSDLDHVSALGKDLIAVLVDVVFEAKEVQVFGSCQIAGREVDAAVKAALNATNRFFDLAMRS
jgi:hypothetical protein